MRVGWAALLAFAAAAAAAPSRPAPARAALESLVREADTVPAEFSADVLIRIAPAAGGLDRAWERELLDEAFRRGSSAQQPLRQTAAPLAVDTRQHAEALAGDTPLDAVSLQLRVVQLMRTLEPAHARELFEWIAMAPDAAGCATALVPDADAYYQALAAVARDSFPANTAGRADALNFFELFAWRAHLPSEMPAVARAVVRLRRTPEEAAYFERVLQILLETSNADARGFAVAGGQTILRVAELELADRALGVDGSALSASLRRHLVDQARAQCADADTASALADAFNAMLRRTGADSGVNPLSAADLRPGRTLGSMRIDTLWQTPDARRLRDESLDLRGSGAQPIPARLRATREWLARADAHLVHVDQWTALGEPAATDAFFEKGTLYIGLVDLVPSGPLRTRVLRSFAEFLHHATVVSRRLWFAVGTRLIELVGSEDRPEVLPILERSGDAVLALYAHAARLALGRS